MKIKSGSKLNIKNAYILGTVTSSFNSILQFDKKVIFDDKSIIKLTDTSFINFGNSQIEGICKEIHLIHNPIIINFNNNNNDNFDNYGEFIIELMCGVNFSCSSWKEKFIPNEMYKSAKCIKKSYNNVVCLASSNRINDKDKSPFKKILPTGAIIGIVMAVLVILIVGIVVGVIVWRKKHPWKINENYKLENLN